MQCQHSHALIQSRRAHLKSADLLLTGIYIRRRRTKTTIEVCLSMHLEFKSSQNSSFQRTDKTLLELCIPHLHNLLCGRKTLRKPTSQLVLRCLLFTMCSVVDAPLRWTSTPNLCRNLTLQVMSGFSNQSMTLRKRPNLLNRKKHVSSASEH